MAETLTGINRAATLLICLGEEAAARVLAELSDTEASKILRAMARIDHIPDPLRTAVFEQFIDTREQVRGHFVKGAEFARRTIGATGGTERSRALMEQFVTDTETGSLQSIARLQPHLVAEFLENEHPQTSALILSTQERHYASEVLALLPEALQSDIVYRIAALRTVSAEVISRIEQVLVEEIGLAAGRELKEVDGLEVAVGLLSSAASGIDQTILETLEESDPEMAEEIRRKMFSFERLVEMDDIAVQMILREVSNDSLTIALKTASQTLKDKIFANMSTRAAEMVREDLETMGPVRRSEVEAMQQSIGKIAMDLDKQGKLAALERSGDLFV